MTPGGSKVDDILTGNVEAKMDDVMETITAAYEAYGPAAFEAAKAMTRAVSQQFP